MTNPDNMKLYNAVRRPPADALKTIKGGRLSGMTDITPQWRYEAITEQFGPCGVGWYYTIDELWPMPCENGEVLANARVTLFIVDEGTQDFSMGIPGIGGNKLVAREKDGLHVSDEGYKMAVTDALSVAFKMLGFGADIYAGKFDGSKYQDAENRAAQVRDRAPEPRPTPAQPAPASGAARDFVIGFGKYKENPQPLHMIPAGYLRFLIKNMDAKIEKGEQLSARDTALYAVLDAYLAEYPHGETKEDDDRPGSASHA